jgi:HK97 family phage portal protein
MNLTLLDLSEAKKATRAQVALPSLASPMGWEEVFVGLKTAAGKVVTRETAMRCGAVLACIRILTEDLASIPFILKEKSAKGAREAIEDPRYRMLKTAPNPLQTAFEVREHQVLDMILSGKFFCYTPRINGRPQGIYPLIASNVHYQGARRNGDLVWSISDPNFPGLTELTQWEMWRGTMLNMNFVDGRALTLLAREAIGLAIAAEEQGARLFSNGIQSNTVLHTESDLDDVSKEELRTAFLKRHAGSTNSWLPILTSGDLTVQRIGLTAQESQYIESRNYQLADVARIFRIPGVLIGLPGAATYASAEQFFQAYVKHTLSPWTTRFEQTADRDLFLPSESRFATSHKFSSLLKADQKTRFAGYREGIEGGFMQPAQARAEEEWDEIEGLDVTWRPANFVIHGREATTTPNGAQNKDLPAENAPKTAENNGKSARLAASIAASIIRSETRQFAQNDRKKAVSEGQAATFSAWLVEKVMDLTGASGPACRAYADWRWNNQDAEAEAKQRLITLCLEGENNG